MRWLFVSDLHYSLPQFDWVLQIAGRYDLVVLAGDALDVGSNVDFRAQTLVVRKYLQRIAGVTRLVVCSGNHDLDTASDSGEKVARWVCGLPALGIATDGDSIVIEDHYFTICPWWDGPEVRQRLIAQIEADAALRGGRRWIWVHHAPPRNSPVSWSGKQTLGDSDVEELIARHRPDLVVSGHIHQSPFVKDGSWVDRIGETWVFNAGHQFGAPPAHIAVDTALGEAVWLSAMGAQLIRFELPLLRPVPSLRALPEWFEAIQG